MTNTAVAPNSAENFVYEDGLYALLQCVFGYPEMVLGEFTGKRIYPCPEDALDYISKGKPLSKEIYLEDYSKGKKKKVSDGTYKHEIHISNGGTRYYEYCEESDKELQKVIPCPEENSSCYKYAESLEQLGVNLSYRR